MDLSLAPVLALAARASVGAIQRISASQLQALLTIDRHGTINLTGLAEALAVLPSSATRLCERMLAADLVTKTPATLDRREVVIRLTSHGSSVVAEIEALRQASLAAALSRMPETSRRALVIGLEALARELTVETTPVAPAQRLAGTAG